MENRLNDASRQQYELVVRDATSSLSATFTARAKKFDGNHTLLTEQEIIKISQKRRRSELQWPRGLAQTLPGGGNANRFSRDSR